MKTYTVIREFYDTQDDNRLYKVGDTYPAYGVETSDERIKSLASNDNVARVPLIEDSKSRRSAFADEKNEDEK